MENTILNGDHNVKEWNFICGKTGGKFYGGMKGICEIKKTLQLLFSMGPDDKDIVYIPDPDMRLVVRQGQQFFLKSAHEQVGKTGGQAGAHGCIVCLHPKAVLKDQTVQSQNEMYQFGDERGWW